MEKKHVSKFQHAFLSAALALYVVITLFGLNTLYESPYTGLRLEPCKGKVCVESVDSGSPASISGVQAGDVLLTVNGDTVPHIVFFEEPDHIRWKKDRAVFERWQQRFQETIIKGKVLSLGLLRDDNDIPVVFIPTHFPLSIALARLLPTYVVAWGSAVLAFLVLRKKQSEVAWKNFVTWCATGIVGISLSAYSVRDIAFPAAAMRALSRINHGAMFFSVSAWINFILVFPRRRKILDVHPWVCGGLYAAAGLLTLLDLAGPFEDTFVLSYSTVGAGIAFIAFMVIYYLAKEQDPVFRKQIQWVVFGMVVSSFFLLILHFIPLLVGLPALSDQSAFLLFAPASAGFAVAITRYRLMDIDTIFDQAVIYGFTILILEGIEFGFMGAATPFYQKAASRLPYLPFITVLLIVFLYAPLRNKIKNTVERIFKRGTYNVEEELQSFALAAGQGDNSSSPSKFARHVMKLLGPSEICLVHLADGRVSDIGDRNLRTAAACVSKELANSHYYSQNRASCFGYELADKKIADEAVMADTRLQSSLFVPFFVEERLSHIAVLLPKSNGTAYSKKDQAFLDALSTNVSHMLEAEEKRRMLENERIRLAREIHDGISSEFTGIISHADKADQHVFSSGGENEIRALMEKIRGSSRRGVQELRNIVWAMSPERQSVGYLAAYIKRFSADFLGSMGIRTEITQELQDEEKMIGPQALLSVFRTVQEACHNIVKHSGADMVRIALRSEGEWLDFSIEDNGKGFAPPIAGRGLGLQNMKRRAEEAGGEFSISSPAGSGTFLKASFRVSDQYPNSGVLK